MDDVPDGLACIARYASIEAAHQRGLVVLSARAPYWLVEEEDGQVALLVRGGDAEQLSYQIGLFERESINWPPAEPDIPDNPVNGWAALIWFLSLILAYSIQTSHPELFDWGRLDSAKVRGGELYRCLSALFLHGDLGHLAGNLLFGLVFIHLVARQTGNLLAIISVLLAGCLGNLMNAWVHFGDIHYSIGASTAVFGCLGILVTLKMGYSVRHHQERIPQGWALPLITGWIMLAWFGTGSEFTDTTAHLFGFACGLPTGFVLGMLQKPETRKAV